MRKLYIIFATGLILSSCNWLDVPPPASVSEQELFKTQEGFQEAVNGIYNSAAHYDLYGGVFSIEMLDAMMQNYAYNASNGQYAKTMDFDFGDGNTRMRFNMVWNKAYSTIANCNLILRNIDSKREEGIFVDGIDDIVEGEARAMRAYVHFDMLRLCVPLDDNGGNNAGRSAIPYVTEYTKDLTPISKASEVIGMIIEDLDMAKELLAEWDPILSSEYQVGYPIHNISTNSTPEQTIRIDGVLLPDFLRNRRHHMNYYAVCGALARVHLWNATAYGVQSSFAEAAANAGEVIDSRKFKWTNNNNLQPADMKTLDRVMYTELVFAFYMENENQIEHLRTNFNNTTNGYYVKRTALNEIYENNRGDIRSRVWFMDDPDNFGSCRILKYLRNSEELGNQHPLVSPAIRLSEMYYILAECQKSGQDLGEQAGDPWATIDIVRDERGLSPLTRGSDDLFKEDLLKEYRKEMFAEGQAFLNYKRLQASFSRQEPYFEFDPSRTGTGNPDGIYEPHVSDGAYSWLPTDETNNRIN